MTRLQSIIIGFLVGLPFALFILLNFLNPAYMVYFFLPNELFDGIKILLVLGVINFLFLYFGFRSNNKRKEKRKADDPPRYPWREIALIILCIILFTLPSLWLVFLYPAVIQVMQMGVTS